MLPGMASTEQPSIPPEGEKTAATRDDAYWRKALSLGPLDEALRPNLPPGLAEHVIGAKVSGTTLVLVVDNPVWAARQNITPSSLLDAARQAGMAVDQVAIRTTKRACTPQSPEQSFQGYRVAGLWKRALSLGRLDDALRPHMPPALADHCRVANVNDGTLVIVVDSPVWFSRVRLSQAALLEAARRIGLQVSRISIKAGAAAVPPPTGEAATEQRQARPVSPAARQAIEDVMKMLGKEGE